MAARLARAAVLSGLVMILVSGCTASPSIESGSNGSAPKPEVVTLPVQAEPVEPVPVSATGMFVSIDGQTTGRVELVAEGAGEHSVGRVAFIDLETPYSRLGVGGSLQPRGADRCFDVGLRTGAGDLQPPNQVDSGALPIVVEGDLIQEIDLYVNGEFAQAGCLNTSVARAQLDWVWG